MARLFRLSTLNDRFNTRVFTFQLPASILKENTPDACSRDFIYGHQIWGVSAVRYEKHVGVYLTLRSVSRGMTVVVDYGFTLINGEHFTKNEMINERGAVFTAETTTHGRSTFIGVPDLTNRGFMHDNGEFVLELEVRNVRCSFEQTVQMPREGKDTQYHQRLCRVETNYFSFGGFDWSLMLYPNGDSVDNDGKSVVGLIRQTNFDHVCRVRYRMYLGQANRIVDSDVMEQMVDIAGRGELYSPGYNLYHLCSSKARLQIKLELISVITLSEVQICPLNRSKNRGHLYDRDKQAWIVESDVSRQHLKLRLFYADIRNVPRMCLRHVMFGVTVLPARGQHARPIKARGSPFYQYYSQNDPDDCFDVSTDITVDSIQSSDSVYLDPEFQRMTIQVEWLETHLLHHERYQRLDDINSKHKHQMLREIMALQAENYALEKQLYSYQVSIAKTETSRVKEEPEPELRDGYRPIPNDREPHHSPNFRR